MDINCPGLLVLEYPCFGRHRLKYLITAEAETSSLSSMVDIHHLTFPIELFSIEVFCLFTLFVTILFSVPVINLYHFMCSFNSLTDFLEFPSPHLYSLVSTTPLLLLHCCFCFHLCCTVFLAHSAFLFLLKLLGYLINIPKHHLIVMPSSLIKGFILTGSVHGCFSVFSTS